MTSLSESAAAFADACRVGRLATATASGEPHVVPVCYARDGDSFYFIIDEKPKRTKTKLKRLRNIEENPRVALVIDKYDDDWTRLAYLLVQGEAALVEDAEEYERALQLLRRRYRQYADMRLQRSIHPLVRIRTQKAHFWKMS